MVNYENVYEAFLRYAASGNQSDWCELWILCQRREEALIKTHFKGKPPIEDIDGIITDATGKAMQKIVLSDIVSVDKISEICWKAAMHTITEYFYSLKRWRRMKNMASILNSAKHYKNEK